MYIKDCYKVIWDHEFIGDCLFNQIKIDDNDFTHPSITIRLDLPRENKELENYLNEYIKNPQWKVLELVDEDSNTRIQFCGTLAMYEIMTSLHICYYHLKFYGERIIPDSFHLPQVFPHQYNYSSSSSANVTVYSEMSVDDEPKEEKKDFKFKRKITL